jgi:hypothetical protein
MTDDDDYDDDDDDDDRPSINETDVTTMTTDGRPTTSPTTSLPATPFSFSSSSLSLPSPSSSAFAAVVVVKPGRRACHHHQFCSVTQLMHATVVVTSRSKRQPEQNTRHEYLYRTDPGREQEARESHRHRHLHLLVRRDMVIRRRCCRAVDVDDIT